MTRLDIGSNGFAKHNDEQLALFRQRLVAYLSGVGHPDDAYIRDLVTPAVWNADRDDRYLRSKMFIRAITGRRFTALDTDERMTVSKLCLKRSCNTLTRLASLRRSQSTTWKWNLTRFPIQKYRCIGRPVPIWGHSLSTIYGTTCYLQGKRDTKRPPFRYGFTSSSSTHHRLMKLRAWILITSTELNMLFP